MNQYNQTKDSQCDEKKDQNSKNQNEETQDDSGDQQEFEYRECNDLNCECDKNKDIIEDHLDRWADVKNFNDLLAANLDFINGILPSAPYINDISRDPLYHNNFLEDCSKKFTKDLACLQHYGILTINGQDAFDTHEYVKFFDRTCTVLRHGFLIFHINVNSFVNTKGKNVINKFVDEIKKRKNELIYIIRDTKTNEYETNIGIYDAYVTVAQCAKPETPETSETTETSTSSSWDEYINLYPDDRLLPFWNIYNHYKINGPNNLLKDTIFIAVATRSFGYNWWANEGDLQDILINICEDISLKKRQFKKNNPK